MLDTILDTLELIATGDVRWQKFGYRLGFTYGDDNIDVSRRITGIAGRLYDRGDDGMSSGGPVTLTDEGVKILGELRADT